MHSIRDMPYYFSMSKTSSPYCHDFETGKTISRSSVFSRVCREEPNMLRRFVNYVTSSGETRTGNDNPVHVIVEKVC